MKVSAKREKEKAPQAEEILEEATPQPEAAVAEPSETDDLKLQLAEAGDKLMRTLAEYDNYRKRSQKERLEIYPEAIASTVAKFLPVLDSFDRALATECADVEFKKGVDMIFTAFQDCLKGLSVEALDPQGEPFDPNFHNAVMHIEDEALGEGIVASVFQKGYKIGDRVLRHAMVQVAN